MSSSRRKLRITFAVENHESERVAPSFNALTGGTTSVSYTHLTLPTSDLV